MTAAVQYYTELVAVEGTEPFVFTAKRVSHQLGEIDYIVINRDAVVF
jgi:Holliday junction resolvase-like predicted endonuclease